MPKIINHGGQMRTIYCPCGHNIVGHPTQLKLKQRLHRKVCELASEDDIDAQVFNGLTTNGWKGTGQTGQAPILKPCVRIDGVTYGNLSVDEIIEKFNLVDLK